MRFRSNIALIVSAGSGIRRATAQIIGAEDGTVVGVDVNGSKGCLIRKGPQFTLSAPERVRKAA